MHRAARLVPTVIKPLRPGAPLLRPTLLSRHCQPGPSTLSHRYASTSSLPSHHSTTSTPLTPSSHADSLDEAFAPNASIDAVEEDELVDREVEELEMQMREGGLEDTFSGGEDPLVGESLTNGQAIGLRTPFKSTEPVIIPLSSLASESPTLPSPSGVGVMLPPDIFNQPLRRDILHRCVVWYRSTLRAGTKKTKSRSEVAYSGKKLRPQKKTGRARLGDRSGPGIKGGAHAHNVTPRDWSQALPRKIRAMGMRIALSSKLDMDLLRVVNSLEEGGWPSTSEAARAMSDEYVLFEDEVEGSTQQPGEITNTSSTIEQAETIETTPDDPRLSLLQRFGPKSKLSILFVHPPSKSPESLWPFARVIRNIPGVEILSTDEIEVYHVLKYRWLVMEGSAIDAVASKFASVDQAVKKAATPVVETGGEMEKEEEDWEDISNTIEANPTPIAEAQKISRGGMLEGEETYEPIPQLITKLPKKWATQQWRKEVGAKRIELAIGHRRARAIAKEVKKGKRKAARVAAKETRERQWQTTLSKMEARMQEGRLGRY